MESLPSVEDYCKNGLFPSQGGIGKKFCSTLLFHAAKFDLNRKSRSHERVEDFVLPRRYVDFDHGGLTLAESGHNDALVLKC